MLRAALQQAAEAQAARQALEKGVTMLRTGYDEARSLLALSTPELAATVIVRQSGN